MRGWLYDQALVPLTSGWYRAVLDRLTPGSHLLDVGVGTAGALATQQRRLDALDLRVTGIDIDADYVRRAHRRITRTGLQSRVDIQLVPIEAHDDGPYDAVYFAASFMLMPDPVAALEHAKRLLRPGGRVFFTQTFQDVPSPLLEKVKPALVRVTGIDFGHVTYEETFTRTLEAAGVRIEEHAVLRRGRARSSRLVVAAPH